MGTGVKRFCKGTVWLDEGLFGIGYAEVDSIA
jgi:hypothetical protein